MKFDRRIELIAKIKDLLKHEEISTSIQTLSISLAIALEIAHKHYGAEKEKSFQDAFKMVDDFYELFNDRKDTNDDDGED